MVGLASAQGYLIEKTGKDEMKVVCFFAPATTLDNYKIHEGVDFPE